MDDVLSCCWAKSEIPIRARSPFTCAHTSFSLKSNPWPGTLKTNLSWAASRNSEGVANPRRTPLPRERFASRRVRPASPTRAARQFPLGSPRISDDRRRPGA